MNTTTYINGNKGTYTGETQTLHGATFYNVLMAEGPLAGKIAVTRRGPDGSDPWAAENKARRTEQQSQFARLARLQAHQNSKAPCN